MAPTGDAGIREVSAVFERKCFSCHWLTVASLNDTDHSDDPDSNSSRVFVLHGRCTLVHRHYVIGSVGFCFHSPACFCKISYKWKSLIVMAYIMRIAFFFITGCVCNCRKPKHPYNGNENTSPSVRLSRCSRPEVGFVHDIYVMSQGCC